MTNSEENSNQENRDYLYRFGVGVMIINENKDIFVGKRIDNKSDAWQMPQGGIDSGEDEDEAMFRELEEETGIIKSNVDLVTKSSGYFYYNLPYKLQKKFWGGKYLGQRQRWYLVEFKGQDNQVNIDTREPEFSNWKWISPQEIIHSIVSFKRPLYEEVMKEFWEYLK
jgi:putative (di)nucleoside polyphosphate hydrolase